MVEDLELEPKPRWVQHQIGGRSGGIVHWTGYDDEVLILSGILTSHAQHNTLKGKILEGTIFYLDASEDDSNKSGKVYIVGFRARRRRGSDVRYEFELTMGRYNN
jgi:phage protein U